MIGSALFGVGWGLVGLCPGPALENLVTLSPRIIVFVVAMAAGMSMHDLWQTHRSATRQEKSWQGLRMDEQAGRLIVAFCPSHQSSGRSGIDCSF